MRLLIVVAVLVCSHSVLAHAEEDDSSCASAAAAAHSARKASNFATARKAFEDAHFCDAETRHWVGLLTAQTCFDSLVASGKPVTEVEDELRGCLVYGRDWRARRELAELALSKRRYSEAARDFDEALAIISEPDLVPTPPPERVLASLFEQGDLARRLAAQFIRSTRSASGEPVGLGSLSVRGFAPKKRDLTVRFEFDKSEFSADGRAAAAELRDALARDCQGRVELIGHTDEIGDEQYNFALSQRRAKALLDFVSSQAMPADCRLQASGRGESEPPSIDNPQDYTLEQRQALARRVELRRE